MLSHLDPFGMIHKQCSKSRCRMDFPFLVCLLTPRPLDMMRETCRKLELLRWKTLEALSMSCGLTKIPLSFLEMFESRDAGCHSSSAAGDRESKLLRGQPASTLDLLAIQLWRLKLVEIG